MREKVEEALEEIRTNLRADGGDVDLVDMKDGVVTLKLTGACGSCPMASLTLKRVVERMLRERVPEVKEVIELQSPKTGVAR